MTATLDNVDLSNGLNGLAKSDIWDLGWEWLKNCMINGSLEGYVSDNFRICLKTLISHIREIASYYNDPGFFNQALNAYVDSVNSNLENEPDNTYFVYGNEICRIISHELIIPPSL